MTSGRLRRPRGVVWLALATAAAAATTLMPHAGAAGPRCAIAVERGDQWSRIPSVMPGTTALAELQPDGCRLLAGTSDGAVYRSSDGGWSWQPSLRFNHPVARIIADGVGAHTIVVAFSGGGIAVSHDDGATYWTPGSLVEPKGEVTAAAADPNDAQTLVVGVAAGSQALGLPAGVGLYVTHDGGRTFTPLPSAPPGDAAALAYLSTPVGTTRRSALFEAVASGPGAGLWMSPHLSAAFVPVLTTPAHDVTTETSAAGDSVVAVATAAGLATSWDGGTTFTSTDPQRAYTGVRTEAGRPDIVMAVSGDGVRRGPTGRAPGDTHGLPSGCGPTGLTRDSAVPTDFLVRCTSGWFRYHSSGVDVVRWRPPPPPPGSGGGGLPGATQMTLLRVVHLPVTDNSSDGSLAFDGKALYFAGSGDVTIHEISPVDGHLIRDLPVFLPQTALSYDNLRNHLYVTTPTAVYDVDLAPGFRTHRLFVKPTLSPTYSNSPTYTYDSSIDRFRVSQELGSTVWEVDRRGVIRDRCSYTVPVPASAPSASAFTGTTGVVSSGDGGVYVELEDDASMLRLDRHCRVLGAFVHNEFSEAANENDSLVCDTVTFYPMPAIWIRDAAANVAEAFAVPQGYCPVPTRLQVSAPRVVRHVGDVCARLALTATGTPIAGMPVSIEVAGRELARPITDRLGRACTPYRADPVRRTLASGSSRSEPVAAVFFGNSAYQPASARGALTVSALAVPAPLPARPPVAPAPAPPVANAAAPEPPPPPGRPNPLGQPAPGALQLNPQPQPQAQGQGQGAAAVAAAPEQEQQLALQRQDLRPDREQHAMSSPASSDDGASGLVYAAALVAALAAAAARRSALSTARSSARR